MRDTYGKAIRVYDTEIPRGIKAVEMSARGTSIFSFDRASALCTAIPAYSASDPAASHIAVAILSDLWYSFCEPLGSLLCSMIVSTTFILQEPLVACLFPFHFCKHHCTLSKLVSEDRLRRKFSEKGAQLIREEFSLKASIDRLEHFYEEICK